MARLYFARVDCLVSVPRKLDPKPPPPMCPLLSPISRKRVRGTCGSPRMAWGFALAVLPRETTDFLPSFRIAGYLMLFGSFVSLRSSLRGPMVALPFSSVVSAYGSFTYTFAGG